MVNRRKFLQSLAAGAAVLTLSDFQILAMPETLPPAGGVLLSGIKPGEDVFTYISRTKGRFDSLLYRQILGAANDYKEGDEIIGVSAADELSRNFARELLMNTRISNLTAHPLLKDELSSLIRKDLETKASAKSFSWTLGELKQFILTEDPEAVKEISTGLSSEVIGCVVKLMTNAELILVGSRIFNPLPGSNIGARGYLGARIQPNSPTDSTEDIFWQVMDGWSYGVGDVVLGTNPVSSNTGSILAIELVLQDILRTFALEEVMPHCVLAHIDYQSAVEATNPGSTALWFQSIAGNDTANATFDISIEKMMQHASHRTGKYGLYFETGQGADFTNGQSHGLDMVLLESRKYGFARALTKKVAAAQEEAGNPVAPWVHLNDVAGFIGPEVFRRRDQLVRCCLEDIVMGKLHGLTIGLDVCATLHMDISLDDLDWCVDQIMPANPAYLMALPTKIDPMLGYLTTGFQDHVLIHEKFGYKVNDRMADFFRQIGILDTLGRASEHFGDPLWVYLQYKRRKGDVRSDQEIFQEGESSLQSVKSHGVFVARGFGKNHWDLEPVLGQTIRQIDADARKCIWAELETSFITTIPGAVRLSTRSANRTDYILHPESGEKPSEASLEELNKLRHQYKGQYNVQIVISDGLDALSITDEGHLMPFLEELQHHLNPSRFKTAPVSIVLNSGRVRAGYRIGENLFANLKGPRAIIHIIGERPGTGHHTFSIYLTSPSGRIWGKEGTTDHNITRVVSGVAATAVRPKEAAAQAAAILLEMFG